jgi:hypothetical protein
MPETFQILCLVSDVAILLVFGYLSWGSIDMKELM